MTKLKNSLSLKIFSKKSNNIQNFIILKLQNNKNAFKTQLFTKLLLKELKLIDFINIKSIKFPLYVSYFSVQKILLNFCLLSKNFLFAMKFNKYILLNIKKHILNKIFNFKKFIFYTLFYLYLKIFIVIKFSKPLF